MWRIEKPTSEGNNANHDKRESHEYKVYIYSTSSFVLERTRRVFFFNLSRDKNCKYVRSRFNVTQ